MNIQLYMFEWMQRIVDQGDHVRIYFGSHSVLARAVKQEVQGILEAYTALDGSMVLITLKEVVGMEEVQVDR